MAIRREGLFWHHPGISAGRAISLERSLAATYALSHHPFKETAMRVDAVDVHFDSTHLFLELSDGREMRLPLRLFPVLEVATAAEREHFAISIDHQQLLWPELDEEMSIAALMRTVPESRH